MKGEQFVKDGLVNITSIKLIGYYSHQLIVFILLFHYGSIFNRVMVIKSEVAGCTNYKESAIFTTLVHHSFNKTKTSTMSGSVSELNNPPAS